MASEQLLFIRAARTRVGVPGQEGRDFTGLRVSFSIEKSSTSNPNTSKVQIYNLSPSSRSFVEQKQQVLLLEVGYAPPGVEPFLEGISSGDIRKVTNERNGTDWLTTFELGDGELALQEAQLNKSFEAGASLTKMIRETAQSFGKAVNNISGITEKTFKSGLMLTGSSKDNMDKLVATGGSEWSIQDDEVIVLGKRETTSEEAILISERTGLIGSPVKREEGVEFTSLLIPRLRPGRRIKIESKATFFDSNIGQSRPFTGEYRVRKAIHTGDTLEGVWETKVEAIEVA